MTVSEKIDRPIRVERRSSLAVTVITQRMVLRTSATGQDRPVDQVVGIVDNTRFDRVSRVARMSIDIAETVDGLGMDRVNGKVVLIISDHLQWNDSQTHFSMLERKVGAYLTFIKNGQLFEALPDARGRDVRIELIHEHAPDGSAERFLGVLKQEVKTHGVDFLAKHLPEGY